MTHYPALSALLDGAAPWIMGILNVTPDSFSDGGLHMSPASALKKIEALDGAALIDIGGESTRPGSAPVPADEELRRVVPVVAEAAKRRVISIDTYKAPVARRCLELGAKIVNDVSAMRADSEMRSAVAEHRAFVVMMFSKELPSRPHASQSERHFKDVVREISEFFEERIEYALAGGIAEERIILDPGMGKFVSHDPRYSWEIIKRFSEFLKLKMPMLVGTSRKGFLGATPDERDPLSQLAALIALSKGAVISRTHNVAMACDFLRAGRSLALLPCREHRTRASESRDGKVPPR